MVGGLSTITLTISVTYLTHQINLYNIYIQAWFQDTPVLHPNHTISIHFNFHSQKKRCPMPILIISLTKRHSASHFEWFTIFLTEHRHRLLARLIGLFHTMISQHHPQPHLKLLWLIPSPIPSLSFPDTHRFMSSHEGSNVQGTPARLVTRWFHKKRCIKEMAPLRSQWCVHKWMIWIQEISNRTHWTDP